MRVHVRSNDEIVAGLLRAEVYYVFKKVLDVSHFVRHAVNDSAKQFYFIALLLAYVGDVNYRRDRLRM